MKGSRNHLRSFTYRLFLNGETYQAKYLDADELEIIVKSPRERGPVDENGEAVFKNNGRGMGKGCRFLDSGILNFDTGSIASSLLLSKRGKHRKNGSGGGSRGGSGSGPRDGSGNGKKLNDCVNS